MTLATFPSKPRAKFYRNKEGCLECRARRKKCDGQRPTCHACSRRKATCHWPGAEKSKTALNMLETATSTPAAAQALSSRARSKMGTFDGNEEIVPVGLHEDVKSTTSSTTSSTLSRSPSIKTLSSPSITREQMRAVGADLFGPNGSFRHFSPFWRMLRLRTDEKTAFTMALDSLTLAQLGVSFDDERLLHHAAITHYGAIRTLQTELERAAKDSSLPDTILSTPYLLFLGQRFTSIASLSDGFDIPAHLLGLSQLLKLRNKKQSEIQLLLADDLQLYSLEWSMIYRQKLGYERPEVEANDNYTGAVPFRSPRFTQHMMKAPDFLAEADSLVASAANSLTPDTDLMDQCSYFLGKLRLYESELMCLLHGWMAQSSSCGFEIVDAASLPSHDVRLDALSQSTFGLAISFSSFAHACMHKRFWQCLHFIRDIGSRVESAVFGQSLSQVCHKSQNSMIVADNIARALIFLCAKSENGSHGYYSCTGPLKLLRPWYEARGFSDKVAWCDALGNFLQDKGIYVRLD